VPALAAQLFGLRHLGANANALAVGAALAALGLANQLAPRLYDADDEGSSSSAAAALAAAGCRGPRCFAPALTAAAAAAASAIPLCLALAVRTRPTVNRADPRRPATRPSAPSINPGLRTPLNGAPRGVISSDTFAPRGGVAVPSAVARRPGGPPLWSVPPADAETDELRRLCEAQSDSLLPLADAEQLLRQHYGVQLAIPHGLPDRVGPAQLLSLLRTTRRIQHVAALRQRYIDGGGWGAFLLQQQGEAAKAAAFDGADRIEGFGPLRSDQVQYGWGWGLMFRGSVRCSAEPIPLGRRWLTTSFPRRTPHSTQRKPVASTRTWAGR
jgi:hypothetical protein